MNLNKVIIVGRLTADPQVRSTPSGQSVSSFSVATNRVWRDANKERREDTEFHNVVCWGRQAEVVRQFVTKGSVIMIEGRLKTRSWQDKEGQNRRTTEIICEQLQLGPKPAGAGGGSWAGNSSSANPVRNSFSNGARSGGAGAAPMPAASTCPSPAAPPREEIPTIDIDGQNTEDTISSPPPSDTTKDDDLPF